MPNIEEQFKGNPNHLASLAIIQGARLEELRQKSAVCSREKESALLERQGLMETLFTLQHQNSYELSDADRETKEAKIRGIFEALLPITVRITENERQSALLSKEMSALQETQAGTLSHVARG